MSWISYEGDCKENGEDNDTMVGWKRGEGKEGREEYGKEEKEALEKNKTPATQRICKDNHLLLPFNGDFLGFHFDILVSFLSFSFSFSFS